MDLFGPVSTTSLRGKSYCFVIVDDFSRFIWVKFLRFKNEAFEEFRSFVAWVERKTECKLMKIHSDQGY